MVDEIDERQEVVRIMQTADLAVSTLFRAGHVRDAWTVRREAITVLQSLGYLKRTPIEFKGEVSVQEILKLANSPDKEDETFLSERSGQGRKNFIANGTS